MSPQISTESMTEDVEVPRGEVQHPDSQTDLLTAVDAGPSDSVQPEQLCLDSQLDVLPIPAESAEPQSVISPHKESLAEVQSLLDTPSPIKRKVKRKSLNLEQSQHRTTRSHLEASSSSEPYSKRLRATPSSPEKPSSSPRLLRKTKSAGKSASQEGSTPEQLPAKRGRLTNVAESQQEVSETPQSGL